MRKFDQIIREAEVAINNNNLAQVQNAVKSMSPSTQNTFNSTLNKIGTQGGDNHDILTKMGQMIDPDHPTQFADLDPDTQTKALGLLQTAGVPLAKPADTDAPEVATPGANSSQPAQASSAGTTPASSNTIPTTANGEVV